MPPEQLRENVTAVAAAVPTLPVASVDVHGGAIAADNGRGVVGFEDEPRGGHVMRGEIPSDVPRGAHVMKDDPLLAIEQRAVHAAKGPALALPDLSTFTPESSPVADGVSDLAPAVELCAATSVHRGAHTRTRRARPRKGQGAHKAASRRWGLVPVAGTAGALVVGLGGGGAFAFFSGGPGTGHVTTGSPVTLTAVATTGPADLLPGDAGAVYFNVHNTDSFGATFDQVSPGATVVSDNTGLCPSSDVSIAPTLPYTFSPAITVSPGGTAVNQSIAGLVQLAPGAPARVRA